MSGCVTPPDTEQMLAKIRADGEDRLAKAKIDEEKQLDIFFIHYVVKNDIRKRQTVIDNQKTYNEIQALLSGEAERKNPIFERAKLEWETREEETKEKVKQLCERYFNMNYTLTASSAKQLTINAQKVEPKYMKVVYEYIHKCASEGQEFISIKSMLSLLNKQDGYDASMLPKILYELGGHGYSISKDEVSW